MGFVFSYLCFLSSFSSLKKLHTSAVQCLISLSQCLILFTCYDSSLTAAVICIIGLQFGHILVQKEVDCIFCYIPPIPFPAQSTHALNILFLLLEINKCAKSKTHFVSSFFARNYLVYFAKVRGGGLEFNHALNCITIK